VAARGRRLIRAGLAAVCLCAAPLRAEELKPLWELGFGFAAIDFPHYRGSDQRKTWLLPFPYVVYRGDLLKADERGRMRGLFFHNENAELDVSANGTVPVKSSENEARQGMPDLDATLEIGPSLNFFLMRSPDDRKKLDLRLPLRTVVATDLSHFRNVGWVFQPNVNLDIHDFLGSAGWSFGVQAGVVYGDRRYHDYFYSVAPEFATPTRPAFDAPGGYSGATFITALSKRFPRFWAGGYVKVDYLRGAAFDDSPLVRKRENYTAGFAIAWVLRESATLVSNRD
jgi:outer membrane protein